MRFFSLYSKSDALVDWRACLDPAAEAIEVRSTHSGMGVNVEVHRELERVLRPALQPLPRRARKNGSAAGGTPRDLDRTAVA